MHRGLGGLRGAALILVIGAGLQLMSGSTASASAAVTSPGAMTVTPTTVVAGSTNNRLTFTYTPKSQRRVDGTVKVTVPTSWTTPQVDRPGKLGSVGTSAGALSVLAQYIVVKNLTLCKTCSLALTYSDVTAPATLGTAAFPTSRHVGTRAVRTSRALANCCRPVDGV